MQYKLHGKSKYLQALEDKALRLIDGVVNTRKTYVSWSGGKDSTAMLHLALRICPDIDVMYMSSGYALPDTEQHIKEVSTAWQLNLHVLKAEVDYIELCREFGLPHLRSKCVQDKVVTMLKKDRAGDWAQENGFEAVLWGLRADESRGRANLIFSKPNGLLDKRGVLRVAPVGRWTGLDIWGYFAKYELPVNQMYLKENCGFNRVTLRNTGWLSTDGEAQGRIEWLRRNYPALYQKIRELI